MSSAGCGETNEVGEPVIVGVEGAFTGVALNPETDPTGLGMLLSLIDGKYWPLQVCGDSGIGVPFNDEDAKNGNVVTEYDEIDSSGNTITAHACLLDCNYQITTEIYAEVIVAMIDGKWNILRVRHTGFPQPLTGPTSECRCCGFNPNRIKFMARITNVVDTGCGGYPACTEWELDPSTFLCNTPTESNPLNIKVTCYSTAGSELEDINDWEVYVCDQLATNLSLSCSAVNNDCENRIPITSGVSEYCGCDDPSSSVEASSSSELSRFELTVDTGVLASCGGCRYNILIYTVPIETDPCALTDVPIDEVYAEACGLPNLNIGDRVILIEVPYEGDHETSSSDNCGPIEYFIIRACTIDDCSDPCEPPPPPPGGCCGMTCDELPTTLTATIEIMDCACACSITVSLPKSACLPGDENGEWRVDYSFPYPRLCETSNFYFELRNLQYLCATLSDTDSSTSSSDPGAYLTFNGFSGTHIESSCTPIYAVFEFTNPPTCIDKMPSAMPPFPDLTCRVRITITE